MSREFPEGFLWGGITAGHVVEGQNVNSDWWVFEHTPGSPVVASSGDAVGAYHLYREDIALMAELGYNAYRFSTEWSRIEPADGEWSRASLDYYRRVAATCLEHGIAPVVTLWHCTFPRWLYDRGSWTWKDAPERFAEYAHRVASHLADELDGVHVVTINEPNLTTNLGYRIGVYPMRYDLVTPGEAAADIAAEHLDRAHRLATDAVRAAAPGARVGLSMAAPEWRARDGGEDVLPTLQRLWEGDFWETAKHGDFIGVQNYCYLMAGPTSAAMIGAMERGEISFEQIGEAAREAGISGAGMADPDAMGEDTGYQMGPFVDYAEDVERSPIGWAKWAPEALARATRRAYELTGLPTLITEAGYASLPGRDDELRVRYIRESAADVLDLVEDGVPVEGYLYCGLFDHYEWNLAFTVTLGLIEVDHETFERRPKPSARYLGRLARANALVEPEPAEA